jgi:hypothetical protein
VLLAAGALACALAAACRGGGEPDGTLTGGAATVTSPRTAEATSAPTSDATPPPADEPATATGIVGAVNRAARFIEINRLSGADVERIEVTAATRIVEARSGRDGRLEDVRAGDRIIAEGRVDPASGALVASKIEYEGATAGSDPGG